MTQPGPQIDESTFDIVLTRFEKMWQSGTVPDIRKVAAQINASAAMDALLDLVKIDMEYRWRRSDNGAAPDAQSDAPYKLEWYARNLQVLGTLAELSPELIRHEFYVRHHWGTTPKQDEYEQRFHLTPEAAATLFEGVERLTGSSGGDTNFGYETVSSTMSPTLRIPGYEILEKIGQGGMGVVYKARQERLNRIVAIKTIRSGELADDDSIQRFKTEASSAANLNHPNIVPVYDVGEHNGLHFLSMGYVEGETLSSRLNENPLPPRDAAKLIRTIAAAVEHAHERGIIHRDLKPSNLLIDRNGDPRVADFGLARVLGGDSELTIAKPCLGSPNYMPPEQAAGRSHSAGPTADVYSLGATLYHALTGRPPFQAAVLEDTMKQVLEDEPVSPARLNPAVDRDLETICLKCLEKSPARRYATARELAEDLQRFDDHKPILARPVGRLQRGRRWCRRKPVAACLITLMLLLAIAGPTVAVILNQTNHRLDNALSNESAARSRAEEKEKEAAEALKRKDDALLETENSIAAYVKVVRNSTLLREPRFKALMQTLLKDALNHYERFAEQHAEDHSLATRIRVAKAFSLIGKINTTAGSLSESIKAYHKALTIYEEILKNGSKDPAIRTRICDVHEHLGSLFGRTGHQTRALKEYETATHIQQDLLAGDPHNPALLHRLAALHHNVARVLLLLSRMTDARMAFQKSISLNEKLLVDDPQNTEYLKGLLNSHTGLGATFFESHATSDSMKEFRSALRILDGLMKRNVKDVRLSENAAQLFGNVGALYRQMGEPKNAEREYRRSISIIRGLSQRNPTVTRFQKNLADALSNLSNLYEDLGKISDSRHSLAQANEILQQLVKANQSETALQLALARCHGQLGTSYAQTHEFRKSEVEYRRKREIIQRLVNDNPNVPRFQEELADCLGNIAVLKLQWKKPAEAQRLLQRMLALREKLVATFPAIPDYKKGLASCLNNLAAAYDKSGDREKADQAWGRSHSIYSELADQHPDSSEYQENLADSFSKRARVHARQSQDDKAEKDYLASIRIRERLLENNSLLFLRRDSLASSFDRIGDFYRKMQRFSESEEAFNRSIDIRQQILRRFPNAYRIRRSLVISYKAAGYSHISAGQEDRALARYLDAAKQIEKLRHQRPDSEEFSSDTRNVSNLIAGIYLNRAARFVNQRPRQADSGVKNYGKSIDVILDSHGENPECKEARALLAHALRWRAKMLILLGRYVEAAEDYYRLSRIVTREADQQNWRALRNWSLARAGDYARASKLTEDLIREDRRLQTVSFAAATFSLCVAAVRRDEMLSVGDRTLKENRYAARAISLLNSLNLAGVFRHPVSRRQFMENPDYLSLHRRADFRVFAKSAGIDLPVWARRPRNR